MANNDHLFGSKLTVEENDQESLNTKSVLWLMTPVHIICVPGSCRRLMLYPLRNTRQFVAIPYLPYETSFTEWRSPVSFDGQTLFSALCPLSPSLSRCHCPTSCWPKLGPVCTRQAFYQDATSPAFPTFSLSFPKSARCPQLTLSEDWNFMNQRPVWDT